MPPVDTGHPLAEYDPDVVVDISTYDRDFVPPKTPDAAMDHHLTSDAYTDTLDDDDSDVDDDVGHHPDFDDATPPTVDRTGATSSTDVATIFLEENEERTDPVVVQPPILPQLAVQPVAAEERTDPDPLAIPAHSVTITTRPVTAPVEYEERNDMVLGETGSITTLPATSVVRFTNDGERKTPSDQLQPTNYNRTVMVSVRQHPTKYNQNRSEKQDYARANLQIFPTGMVLRKREIPRPSRRH
jgi:hypothetical protein